MRYCQPRSSRSSPAPRGRPRSGNSVPRSATSPGAHASLTSRHVDPEISNGLAPTPAPTEAPAAFDNLTNGFDPQGPPFDTLDDTNVIALRSFNENRFIFEEVERAEEGLGPTYNAQSCRECHQNIVTGGASQVTVQRAGHLSNGDFFDSQGGSLIHSRATDPDAMELLSAKDPIRSFRISPNTLGDGFIEAIANDTLMKISSNQPFFMRGLPVQVAVLEAQNHTRIGRFGWKGQHASLESFAADAYLNEMGITTPTLPTENTSAGNDVSQFDPVPDPEDDGEDVKAFANFMRATKAPPRGRITQAVTAGEQVFNRIGCNTCHVASITTAPAGTIINGGAMTVPAALGNKIIHPYSDFLLHDVGTGDGIPIQPTDEYREHGEPDQDGAALGAADPQSPDARRDVVHARRSDSAPRQSGGEFATAVSEPEQRRTRGA